MCRQLLAKNTYIESGINLHFKLLLSVLNTLINKKIVRLEASKNKVVVANSINITKYEKNRTVQYFQAVTYYYLIFCAHVTILRKLTYKDTIEENRNEFKAPVDWQYQVSAELSELRDKVRKEKNNFLKEIRDNNSEFVILISKLNEIIFS